MIQTALVPLNRSCLAILLLSLAASASAQTAPANVVTPAPPPREGTVGPEQLRDFSLPGTRTTPAPTPAPAPNQAPASPPASSAPVRTPQRPAPPASREAPPEPTTQRTRPPASPRPADPTPAPAPSLPGKQATVDLGAPVPGPGDSGQSDPAASTPEVEPSPPLPPPTTRAPWWPWFLLAGIIGAALAFFLRRRQQGPAEESLPTLAPAGASPVVSPNARQRPAAPVPPEPQPSPEPALPSGLVTTRLRPRAEPKLEAQPEVPVRPSGGVVSTGLRPWIELDLAMSDIALTESEALLRFRLALLNSGTAEARDIAIEALALSAGDTQSAELGTFFARAAGSEVAVAQLGRLATAELVHEVRMPRGAIREFAAGDRRLFVPLLAFNASYRWHSGTGRTSAAFLLGHEQPGADRLAPLRLDPSGGRLVGLGVRRLEDQIRR